MVGDGTGRRADWARMEKVLGINRNCDGLYGMVRKKEKERREKRRDEERFYRFFFW